MKRRRIELSPGAALAVALLLVLLRPGELLALFLPILAHELGHVLAILALGQHIRAFQAEMGGFRLHYDGGAGPAERAMIAAAGPLAGFLYALCASALAAGTALREAELSAGLSLAQSLLNLLPIRGLDGGEILSCLLELLPWRRRGEAICTAASCLALALLLGLGLYMTLKGEGAALLLAAFWLLISGLRADAAHPEKRGGSPHPEGKPRAAAGNGKNSRIDSCIELESVLEYPMDYY